MQSQHVPYPLDSDAMNLSAKPTSRKAHPALVAMPCHSD